MGHVSASRWVFTFDPGKHKLSRGGFEVAGVSRHFAFVTQGLPGPDHLSPTREFRRIFFPKKNP